VGYQQPKQDPTKSGNRSKHRKYSNRDNDPENDAKHTQISFFITDKSCLFDELGMIIIAQTKKGG